MTKVDQLIEKFKEFKDELNKACPCGDKTDCGPSCPCPKGCKCKRDSLKKNMNGAMNPGMNKPNMTTGTSGGQGGMFKDGGPAGQDMMALKFEKNGQWKLDKVDPQENINIPHPKGKAKMADGVNKDENYISQDGKNREANPKLRQSDLGPGGKVHMVKDEGTNEEASTSRPHNKEKFKVMDPVKEKEQKHASPSGLPYNGKDKDVKKGEVQGNEARGFDENKAPGRGTLTT